VAGGHKGVKDARFDLLPVDALWQVARVFGEGAKKYAERNWERGIPRSSQKGALDRHLALYWAGENNDPETGLPHLAHVAWHALTMLALHLRGQEEWDSPLDYITDDRPTTEGLYSMTAEVTNPEAIEAAQAEVVLEQSYPITETDEVVDYTKVYEYSRLPLHTPEFGGDLRDWTRGK
jgi:hypothetical protein